MRRLSIVVACLVLTGQGAARAEDPTVVVKLVKASPSPEFSFKVAGTDHGPLVESLAVMEDERGEVVCALHRKERAKPRRVAKWTYGESLRGFSGERCKRLPPGRYLILVIADDARGAVKLVLEKSGQVVFPQ
jgi:hypothetical protein